MCNNRQHEIVTISPNFDARSRHFICMLFTFNQYFLNTIILMCIVYDEPTRQFCNTLTHGGSVSRFADQSRIDILQSVHH